MSCPLTITTFNIRFGSASDGPNAWRNRCKLLLETVCELNSDILCLQEAERFQIEEIVEGLKVRGKTYEWTGVGREDGRERGEYSPILFLSSRFELPANMPHGTFWLSPTPDRPSQPAWNAACERICTFALLRLREDENTIMVFNTHLDHVSAKARLKGVELILGRVNKLVEQLDEEQRGKLDFVTLTGDFNNQGLRDAEIRKCIDAGFEDGYYMKHRNYNGGTFHAFTGRPLGVKIDWIWLGMIASRRPVKVENARVVTAHSGNRWPSDHFPVSISTSGYDRSQFLSKVIPCCSSNITAI